jgi:exodeoxyribonuclease V alpha subunit
MTQHYVMLQRNLLYTGVTRGKKFVILVGTRKAIGIAVKNNKISKRNTWLYARLRSGCA